MVWSSASSTLIGPFVVAFVFRSSPNTHPLRSVGAFGNALYPLRLSVSGSSPLRGRRGAHPYVAPCEFERYSPECVEGKFCELRLETAFSEVRCPQAAPSNRKDTPYGGCALYLVLDTVIALASRQD